MSMLKLTPCTLWRAVVSCPPTGVILTNTLISTQKKALQNLPLS